MKPALAAPPVVLALLLTGCTDREAQRLKATTRAKYDPRSGRLQELTYDANRNGRIDTWTEMDGARPIRSRIDRDEDGRIDRWEYYDAAGHLTRVGFSRSGGDKPDAWAYPDSAGRIERIEVSSTADESRIDRWEHYDTATANNRGGRGDLKRVEQDSNGDGRPDRWEAYEAGALATVEFDEDFDGRPDRRLTYRDSALELIETEPNSSGHYTKRVEVPR